MLIRVTSSLIIDTIRFGFSTEEIRAFVEQRQHFDHTVAYIGNCQSETSVVLTNLDTLVNYLRYRSLLNLNPV